ncbi:hypothetical protein [Leptospira kirschneri]|uniref:Transposase domain protein n=1 Tax=Leptospira kirschneri str. 200802841 TaxID=1193047 RepID=A0A828Y0K6_9LEPT|nr:hypothetical protein LEP1GSC131_1137 [Leptospira kirschneri str. 200802841]
MESQEVKYVGVDCGKKSIEVVRINSENSLERRQFSTTESGIVITSYSIHYWNDYFFGDYELHG